MTDKEYYKHKYEITAHPGLKEFYKLRLEGHTALCAITMVEDHMHCICKDIPEEDKI